MPTSPGNAMMCCDDLCLSSSMKLQFVELEQPGEDRVVAVLRSEVERCVSVGTVLLDDAAVALVEAVDYERKP